MPFPTAAQHKIQRLYHWQRLDAMRLGWIERIKVQLASLEAQQKADEKK